MLAILRHAGATLDVLRRCQIVAAAGTTALRRRRYARYAAAAAAAICWRMLHIWRYAICGATRAAVAAMRWRCAAAKAATRFAQQARGASPLKLLRRWRRPDYADAAPPRTCTL